MLDQGSLNVVAHVRRSHLADLETLLESMSPDPGGNGTLPFESFPNIHFARFVVLPESVDHRGNGVPPTLVLATNFDGGLRAHLGDLVRVAGKGLDEVFGHCEDYPSPDKRSEASRMSFLQAHRVKTNTLFVNTRGRTVEQVARERSLRETIQAFLSSRDWSGVSALEVVDAIKAFVREEPKLGWALEPPESAFGFRLIRTLKLVGFALGALALTAALFVFPLLIFVYPQLMYDFPFLILFFPLPWVGLILFLAILRFHELKNIPDDFRPPNDRLRENESPEDIGTHNQVSTIGFLQKGLFRRGLVRIILCLVNFGTENLFYRGHLAGVDTIHFARWVMIERGRVFFFSNYDGSLESYNDDFVDRIPYGLNLIFSNAQGWPRTRFLIFGGARDGQAFKLYLRDHQIRTHVWYVAPPNRGLTAANVARNTKIRAGIGRQLNAAQAAAWLRLL